MTLWQRETKILWRWKLDFTPLSLLTTSKPPLWWNWTMTPIIISHGLYTLMWNHVFTICSVISSLPLMNKQSTQKAFYSYLWNHLGGDVLQWMYAVISQDILNSILVLTIQPNTVGTTSVPCSMITNIRRLFNLKTSLVIPTWKISHPSMLTETISNSSAINFQKSIIQSSIPI